MKPNCIVCNETKSLLLFKTKDRMFDMPGSFLVRRCQHCGLVFQNPIPSKKILNRHYPKTKYYSYKQEIAGLSGLISKFRSYLIKHYYHPTMLSQIFSSIVKEVPGMPAKKPHKKAKILDVGCGSGKTIELIKKLGWNVYGLEIDKNAVQIAKERGLKKVKLGDYKKIADYPNNYFDCIRLYHVIEHLPNPRLCIQLVYKKLKPGGEIILGTPNSESLVSKVFGGLWYNLDIPRHLFIFSPKTLTNVIKSESFTKPSILFCSSDGLGRSIVYTVNKLFKINLDTNKFTMLFFIFYPIEWIIDKFGTGDFFTLRAVKN